MGLVDLPLATTSGIPPIHITLDVVAADVPALLGLDVLDDHLLSPNTVTGELVKYFRLSDKGPYHFAWMVPLTRQHGHIYAEMSFATVLYYSVKELSKLHRHFSHPSADKLYQLLRRARPEDTSPSTYEVLKDLSRRCDPCQRMQIGPTRFKVSFGAEHVRFNERIIIDVMYVDGKPVLHIVDEGTRFSAARFLPDVSTRTIWATILMCWASVYTGLPHKILVDQGSAFGNLFISIGAASRVEVQRTGIEAHSSLGVGERYHQPLRSTFRKLKADHPHTSPDLLLSAAVKALNDTLGPEGLVPSALVFGEYPSTRIFSDSTDSRAPLESRAKLATTARKEMESLMANLRVQRALRHAVPPPSDNVIEVGQKVLVWREKMVENRIGEWIGPFLAEAVDGERKLVFVRDSKVGAARPFGLAQVKPYLSSTHVASLFMHDLRSNLSSEYSHSVFATETLSTHDPRATSPEMSAAKRKEIQNLMNRGTFKVILKQDIPPDGNVLPGRFVLAIKSTEDGKQKWKARYVIGGHRDKLKRFMVHSSQTIQPSSVRLILALSAVHDFDVWTSDVTQAYLQSAEPLQRKVYIREPVPEFELAPNEALLLLRGLYGLGESGDLWHDTLDQHHRRDLGMKPLLSDPACYYLLTNGSLSGMSGTYVDDMLRVGKADFREVCRATASRFEVSEDEVPPCNFTGLRLSRGNDGALTLDQVKYADQLKPLPADAAFGHFASIRMQLMWLTHTRADCIFEVSQLSQVTRERFEEEKAAILKRTNRLVQYAREHKVSVSFPRLDLDTTRVVGFSDASFAGNVDLTSQLGFIIFLVDGHNRAIPMVYRSYKARRVTRSVMAAELIAFSDLFDAAYTLSQELQRLHSGRRFAVNLFTDSKALFDVISKGTRTSEKRLMLDIACAREGYLRHEISDIGFVRSGDNIADGLTKTMSQALLRSALLSGSIAIKPEQWILRSASAAGKRI